MRFLAVEHRFPTRKVTNDEVREKVLEASSSHLSARELCIVEELLGACFESAGTRVRFHLAPGESACELAAEAGRRALAAAGLDPADIDLLLYVGIGRGMVEPASASIYQDMLALRRATAFDVLDACASWVRALHVADAFLRSGSYRTIMIMNAEFVGDYIYRYDLRSLEEFAHWHPAVTIGEAATATIVTAAPDDDDQFEASFRTWGDKRDLCFVPLPNFEGYFGKKVDVAGALRPHQFVSYGLSLMEFGTRKLIEHYRDLPQFSEFKADVIFGHSASDGASRRVVEGCGIDSGKYRFDHQHHANTVSASMPVSMSEAVKTGELADGDRVLLMAASAGVTTALVKFVFRGR
jgi:3-oxoacyl-[acyl-carrier-protein] synthase III